MNGIDFLAVTNAILYLLSGNECMKPFLGSRLAVSSITFMELLSYSMITEQEEQIIRAFLKGCELIQLNDDIMEQTIQLRKTYKIKLPDAIIAATAKEFNIPLITADTGFNKIDGLKLSKLEP